jgi:hypothetical protein
MEYKSRILRFKAWNKESKLLMRLNSIDCVKGELFKKDHILLQFTGLYDKQKEEIYELDVLLMDSEKLLVRWDEHRNGWGFTDIEERNKIAAFTSEIAGQTMRLCNYFESDQRK